MGSQVALEWLSPDNLEATVDLTMAEALSIPEALTQHVGHLLRMFWRIQLAQAISSMPDG